MELSFSKLVVNAGLAPKLLDDKLSIKGFKNMVLNQ